MEIEKGEDEPAEENPECRPVSKNHEAKNCSGCEKEHERRHKLVAFFDSLQGEPGAAGKEEEQEHLRQSRQRELPHQVAENNDGTPQKGDQFVKETAGHMIPNPDGEEKKQNASACDNAVSDIDQIGRC